ncbi:MAG: YceI family protein [Acidobacteria bacterium]|nr:YceI family protein [Acidobacteriota bacterium]MCL5288783.1 YceI family protein [Acidobacteriota bacterium]
MRSILRAAVLLLAASLPCAAQVTTWQIDPAHSAAQFSVRHMMISTVRGDFQKMTGTLLLDEKDVTKSSIDVTIDATTVDTREERRNNHLKSADFLDVANFPTMTFKSKSVSAAGEGRLKVTGDLTIRGVTKEVVLDVDGPTPAMKAGNQTRRGVSATTRINRKDFGVRWSRAMDGGGVVVSDDVNITLDVEFLLKPPAAN